MTRTCPHCATENPDDAAFCKACGRSLDFDPEPSEPNGSGRDPESGSGRGEAPPPVSGGSGQVPAEGPPQDRAAFGGFWRRVLAVLIDGVILGIPLTVVQAMVSPETMHTEEWTDADTAWTFVNILVGWFYFAGMHSSQYRATIGKMAVGLRVVDWHGERISFARATGRHFAEFLSGLLFMIGYLMVAFTRQRRALHDFIAETWVVRREWLDE
ncbi:MULTISPECIES: RDD family protein [unclassified Thioalkalivibrio]|uniref:RDD family protein n=1 Tax=unclassified Thioalkalivibrio TaxID=2621013 RepID=UPI00037A0ADA|nr:MULTISPECIES: RDD family protein [unclassified Thioalkalivibrio]